MPSKKSTAEKPAAKAAKKKDSEEKQPRQHRVVDRASFQEALFKLWEDVDTETQKWQAEKSHGVKFLKTVRKRLATLKNDSYKALKMKRPSRRSAENSGFKKKRTITKELAAFASKAKIEYHDFEPKTKDRKERKILKTYNTENWTVDQKQCRNDVTKAICEYIRREGLQNPEDKRIINPDKALSRLLGDDYEGNLTYFKLQKLISKLFIEEPKKEKEKKPEKKKKSKKDEEEVKEEPKKKDKKKAKEEPKEESEDEEEEEDVEEESDE